MKNKKTGPDEEKEQDVSQIRVGDVEVLSTTKDLKHCVGVVKDMLENKSIKNYLEVNLPKKKLMGL